MAEKRTDRKPGAAPTASSPDRIRNVALVGPAGSGKTSLLESLLNAAGATTRRGTVTDGTTDRRQRPGGDPAEALRRRVDRVLHVERHGRQPHRHPRLRRLHGRAARRPPRSRCGPLRRVLGRRRRCGHGSPVGRVRVRRHAPRHRRDEPRQGASRLRRDARRLPARVHRWRRRPAAVPPPARRRRRGRGLHRPAGRAAVGLELRRRRRDARGGPPPRADRDRARLPDRGCRHRVRGRGPHGPLHRRRARRGRHPHDRPREGGGPRSLPPRHGTRSDGGERRLRADPRPDRPCVPVAHRARDAHGVAHRRIPGRAHHRRSRGTPRRGDHQDHVGPVRRARCRSSASSPARWRARPWCTSPATSPRERAIRTTTSTSASATSARSSAVSSPTSRPPSPAASWPSPS